MKQYMVSRIGKKSCDVAKVKVTSEILGVQGTCRGATFEPTQGRSDTKCDRCDYRIPQKGALNDHRETTCALRKPWI